MGIKPLEKIKHGYKIFRNMRHDELYFVEDLRRLSGLDDKTLRTVLQRLLKNNYIHKNEHGQWFVPGIADDEEWLSTDPSPIEEAILADPNDKDYIELKYKDYVKFK